MKRYLRRRHCGDDRHSLRAIARTVRREAEGGFRCAHCRRWVIINPYIGTANRNHCPQCLWSRHVDVRTGDRQADCRSGMRPIGLSFRQEGRAVRGELMLVHLCSACPKLSINRIAADDDERQLLGVFELSFAMASDLRAEIRRSDIYLADPDDRQEVMSQLFGYGG